MTKNVGKIFEDSFIKSVSKLSYCWHKRLNDNASSWAGGDNTRFTSTNECDFLLFNTLTKTLYALELKSTNSTLTFWRKDFEIQGKKQTFNIKKNQILGLMNWNHYPIICGLIINFRNENNDTYFIYIKDFVEYTNNLNKKSININDIEKMKPIKLESKKLRTNYLYKIDDFFVNTSI